MRVSLRLIILFISANFFVFLAFPCNNENETYIDYIYKHALTYVQSVPNYTLHITDANSDYSKLTLTQLVLSLSYILF